MIPKTGSFAARWLVGALPLVLLSGCAGPSPQIRAVHEDERNVVRLEVREDGEKGSQAGAVRPFAHPASLSEADWVAILEGIRVQPPKRLIPSLDIGQAGPREAFSEAERQYLARHLAASLLIARPDEWVVFFLAHPRTQGGDMRGGAGVTEATSGGFFVEEGQLHLLLANYRHAVTVKAVLSTIRENPMRPASEALYELVEGPHQTVRADAGLGLGRVFRAVPELVIDYRAWLTRPDKKLEHSEAVAPQKPQALEDRLRALQRIWEQGLITEEEYRLKRQELLDEL